jgi:hypothetical protein
MKKRLFKPLLMLPFIILLLSGCNTGISSEVIKNAIYNEENCLKGCDQMEDKAMAEYEECKKEAHDWFIAQNCTTLVCLNNAIERHGIMLVKCYEDYKKKLAEVRQCRKDCMAKFPLELKVK